MCTTKFKKMILATFLMAFVACGGGNGGAAVDQSGEAGAASTMTGLALTPEAGSVDDACELETIDGKMTTSEENNGVEGGPETAASRIGVYLKLRANQNLDVVFSDYLNLYTVHAEDHDFQVLMSDGLVNKNASASLVSSASGGATSVMELNMHGMNADGHDEDYFLVIPAGSVTCADGRVTQTEYTVAFTITGVPGVSIVYSDDSQTSQEVTETEFVVAGEEISDCFPLNIEGTSQTVYSENGSEPTLALSMIMNQRDERFAWPVGWRDIDASKISLTDSNGRIVNVEPVVPEMIYEFAAADYMNSAEFAFTGMPETKTTYSLTLLPGAMECVDNEGTFANTATYNAQIRVGDVRSCTASDGVDGEGNPTVSNSCETQ